MDLSPWVLPCCLGLGLHRSPQQQVTVGAGRWPEVGEAERQGPRRPQWGQRRVRAPAARARAQVLTPLGPQVTYGSFDYTSLLYLSDYLDDFGGGRFVFMEEGANKTVEPRAGRARRRLRGGAAFREAPVCWPPSIRLDPDTGPRHLGAYWSEAEAGVSSVTAVTEPAPPPVCGGLPPRGTGQLKVTACP